MKLIKTFLFFAIMFLSIFQLSGQTYCFTSPQGFGASATGGNGGPVTIVTTMDGLKNALSASGKGVVIVSGSIQCDYLSVLINDKTLLGLPGAKLYTNIQVSKGSGILNIKPGSNNVIIRNLIFEGPGAWDEDGRDCLTNEATNLWVDHCEFRDGMDGNFDNKGDADNVTVSWCKFTYLKPPKAGGSGGADDHRYSNLVSSSDSDVPQSNAARKVTWQYCWWAPGCVERMVRARNAQLHQLNCYWNSQNTNKAIGLSAGVAGCSDYVENGVFACSGKITDLSYGGSPSIKFVNCIGGGTNVGTVNKPTYSYEVTPVDQVVSVVTNTSCGAGATLKVTTTGAVSASCGTPPTTYTLTTNATNGTITRSPNATSYNSGTVVTLTAIPNSGYLFSGWSGDASGTSTTASVTMNSAKTVTAIFTQISIPSLVLSSGSVPQTVSSGVAITDIVYTWGGSSTDVTVTNLPAGLQAIKNSNAKTVTISGTPTAGGTYTITSVQPSGTAVVLSGTISVSIPPSIQITSPANNFTANAPATISITASASDTDGTISKVEFFNGNTLLNSDASSPYSYNWSDVASGTYLVKAIATDNSGATASAEITITVLRGANEPLVIQGETACAVETGIALESKNSGYYGDGYVNLDNSAGTYVRWNISSQTAQKVSMKVRYASSTQRNMSVTVNGILQVVELQLPSTGAFTTWSEAIAEVDLIAGDNSITLTSLTAEGGPNIDQLTFESGTVNTTTTCTQVTINPNTPTLVLSTGTADQTVISGLAITNIVYTWGGGATDVTISELPAGLTSSKNNSDKTVTISGKPTVTGTYSITTIQNTGASVSLSGTITVKNEGIALRKGWNLIGFPFTETQALENGLSSVWQYVEEIKDFDGFYKKTQADYLNSLLELNYGKGYLLKVSQECILIW